MAKSGPDRKKRVEAEAYLVSSYIAWAYPNDQVMVRVRLGIIEPLIYPESLSAEELGMLGSFRRWADAVVIQSDQLILIEGAIRPALGDISQMEGYKLLLPQTPELDRWKALPIRMELVAAIEDPVVSMLARGRGINFIRFTTPETDEYIAQMLPRFQRAPRTGGLIASA